MGMSLCFQVFQLLSPSAADLLLIVANSGLLLQPQLLINCPPCISRLPNNMLTSLMLLQLFGQWLSTAYIAFAQLGMPFPGAAVLGAGWAWAGSAAGGASEAIGLDSFVQVSSQAGVGCMKRMLELGGYKHANSDVT
jgi:hypothetical protein